MDNARKTRKSSITLEQLLDKIKKFNARICCNGGHVEGVMIERSCKFESYYPHKAWLSQELAQLVEYLVWSQGVGSSSLLFLTQPCLIFLPSLPGEGTRLLNENESGSSPLVGAKLCYMLFE